MIYLLWNYSHSLLKHTTLALKQPSTNFLKTLSCNTSNFFRGHFTFYPHITQIHWRTVPKRKLQTQSPTEQFELPALIYQIDPWAALGKNQKQENKQSTKEKNKPLPNHLWKNGFDSWCPHPTTKIGLRWGNYENKHQNSAEARGQNLTEIL